MVILLRLRRRAYCNGGDSGAGTHRRVPESFHYCSKSLVFDMSSCNLAKVIGVAKPLSVDGVGTDVVLVLHLTGLEVLLQAGVEAGVEEVWRPLWWQV